MTADTSPVLFADLHLDRADLAETTAVVRACHEAGFVAVVLHDDGNGFEATTLAAALGVTTEQIGLLVAAAPGGLEPYHFARFTASLDHLGGGRGGWFVPAGPDRSGAVVPATAAIEYADVVRGLWDSFTDEAFVRDAASGQYWELAELHALDHVGPHYSVAGPLNVARPPQGHPLVVSARPDLAQRADLVTEPYLGDDAVAAAAGAGSVSGLVGTGREGRFDGLLVPVRGIDDPVLAAASARRAGPGSGTTLRERLGFDRPANTLVRVAAGGRG
jgi:alkanesulfonate monooxygenase SsuD/methylene tetrahydromethanopterin reductase-like flavin-dependent oxidoreductase (luciferase family)